MGRHESGHEGDSCMIIESGSNQTIVLQDLMCLDALQKYGFHVLVHLSDLFLRLYIKSNKGFPRIF